MNPDWSERMIATIFDEMADEYDDIFDLWYAWLFSRLHVLIINYLSRTTTREHQTCLDVGCGTGFQSILLSICGFRVRGIDLSYRLIKKAKEKNALDYLTKDLFSSRQGIADTYSDRIRHLASKLRSGRPVKTPRFSVASALAIPFPASSFDIVICCGSTLSIIEDYKRAMEELSRVLRPGGILILEAENKYNLDLLWPLVDRLLFGRLGYNQTITTSLRNAISKRRVHSRSLYPFSMRDNEVNIPMWLFSSTKLQQELESAHIYTEQIHSIHSITNFLPSVILDDPKPSRLLTRTFSILAEAESCLSSLYPINHLGCSVVLLGRKE